jgi:hypothetical protein
MLDDRQRVINEAPQRAAPASAIEIFRERAEARVLLIHNGLLDFHLAIDELQESAVSQGLVATYGQDRVQEIMSQAFARWRL